MTKRSPRMRRDSSLRDHESQSARPARTLNIPYCDKDPDLRRIKFRVRSTVLIILYCTVQVTVFRPNVLRFRALANKKNVVVKRKKELRFQDTSTASA